MITRSITSTIVLLACINVTWDPAIAQTGVKKYEAQEIQKAQELRRKREALERSAVVANASYKLALALVTGGESFHGHVIASFTLN